MRCDLRPVKHTLHNVYTPVVDPFDLYGSTRGLYGPLRCGCIGQPSECWHPSAIKRTSYGVNFSPEILIKRKWIQFQLAGDSSYPSSSWPSENDQKVGWNPRKIGLSSSQRRVRVIEVLLQLNNAQESFFIGHSVMSQASVSKRG